MSTRKGQAKGRGRESKDHEEHPPGEQPRDEVVENHAEGLPGSDREALAEAVELADRRRFHHIKKAKKQELNEKDCGGSRKHPHGDEVAEDLVDHDLLGVGLGRLPAPTEGGPPSGKKDA